MRCCLAGNITLFRVMYKFATFYKKKKLKKFQFIELPFLDLWFHFKKKIKNSWHQMYCPLDVTIVSLFFRHLKDVILLTAIVEVLSVISSYFWYLWLLVRTLAEAVSFSSHSKAHLKCNLPNFLLVKTFFLVSHLKKIFSYVTQFVLTWVAFDV